MEERVQETSLLEKHTELGDGLLPWAVGVFVTATAIWFAYRRASSSGIPSFSTELDAAAMARPRTLVWVIAAVLSVAVAAGSIVQVYRIGDSGAKSVWQGSFSTTGN